MIIMYYMDVLELRIIIHDKAYLYEINTFFGLILPITVLREEMSHL